MKIQRAAASLLWLATLRAKLGARLNHRAAARTFTGRQRGAALLAEARVVRIDAATLRAGTAGIAALRISLVAPVAAMFGTVVTALITAGVATQSPAHQIAQ